MPSHHRRSSARRTTLLLSLLLFISTAALFYIRARWSRPVLPHSFPASAILDQKTGYPSSTGGVTSCNCTSPTMPDPGVFPGGKTQSKQGWNVMPDVQGATLDTTTFRVDSGTLTTYITSSYDPRRIKRVVVMVHGLSRTSWNQQLYASLALDKACQNGAVSRDEVVVLAPHFFTSKDAGAFPSDAHGRPLSDALVWKGTEWADGTPSKYPKGSTVGAFDALDAVIDHFLDLGKYPNLGTIVIGGFSLGAQLVTRYSTLRPPNAEQDGRISYWVGAPNSFLYLDRFRPYPTERYPDFNEYKYGLEGSLPPYLEAKGVVPSLQALAPNLLNRRISYCVGLGDLSAGSDVGPAAVQGAHHVSKVQHWVQDYLPFLPGSTGSRGVLPPRSTVDYIEGASHQDWKVLQSECTIKRLFLEESSRT